MLLLLASSLGDFQLDLDATLADLIRIAAQPGLNLEMTVEQPAGFARLR
jgi:hypothetical protein